MALLKRPAIYTDYYELTMAQGYYLSGMSGQEAVFDYFFRENPFRGGYVIFAGLSDLMDLLLELRFHDDEIEYLRSLGFHDEFLSYLKDFRFRGSIHSVREGEVVFPREPLLRVEAPIVEAQIIETLLLNILNFESLIATKAARMCDVAGSRKVIDFGLRRSQGYGGIQASKAAVIGGVESTSNVYSAFVHGLPPSGTMAHSWIQSFDTELEAFRKFAEYYPENTVLLVDTYDTLKSGVPSAIKVGKEMEQRGHRLKGIRLDSGDLAYFARKSRKMLDEAGLDYVKIAASNQLDEHLIKSLINQGAPIDLFGVGTRLVTGHESPALDGVYKLGMIHNEPKLKISENIEKITLPGRKKVIRFFNSSSGDMFYGDGIFLEEEEGKGMIYHPFYPGKNTDITHFNSEPLFTTVMEKGKLTHELPPATQSAEYVRQRLQKMNPEHKRFENPHVYKVGISTRLRSLRDELIENQKEKARS